MIKKHANHVFDCKEVVFETISDFFKVGVEKLHTLQAQIMEIIRKGASLSKQRT
jgi:hypothetical protein